jgi:hypothetical protein
MARKKTQASLDNEDDGVGEVFIAGICCGCCGWTAKLLRTVAPLVCGSCGQACCVVIPALLADWWAANKARLLKTVKVLTFPIWGTLLLVQTVAVTVAGAVGRGCEAVSVWYGEREEAIWAGLKRAATVLSAPVWLAVGAVVGVIVALGTALAKCVAGVAKGLSECWTAHGEAVKKGLFYLSVPVWGPFVLLFYGGKLLVFGLHKAADGLAFAAEATRDAGRKCWAAHRENVIAVTKWVSIFVSSPVWIPLGLVAGVLYGLLLGLEVLAKGGAQLGRQLGTCLAVVGAQIAQGCTALGEGVGACLGAVLGGIGACCTAFAGCVGAWWEAHGKEVKKVCMFLGAVVTLPIWLPIGLVAAVLYVIFKFGVLLLTGLAKAVELLGEQMGKCCDALGRGGRAFGRAVAATATAAWTPIGNGLKACTAAVGRTCTALGKGMDSCCQALGRCIGAGCMACGDGVKVGCQALAPVCKALGTLLFAPCLLLGLVGQALQKPCAALGNACGRSCDAVGGAVGACGGSVATGFAACGKGLGGGCEACGKGLASVCGPIGVALGSVCHGTAVSVSRGCGSLAQALGRFSSHCFRILFLLPPPTPHPPADSRTAAQPLNFSRSGRKVS